MENADIVSCSMENADIVSYSMENADIVSCSMENADIISCSIGDVKIVRGLFYMKCPHYRLVFKGKDNILRKKIRKQST